MATTEDGTAAQDGTAQNETAARQVAAQRAATVAQFATTAPVQQAVLTAAAETTGLPLRSPSSISATADGGSPFLTITVRDSEPAWAQAVANAYATAMPAALASIDATVAAAAQQLNVLTPAPLPQSPVSPNRTQYLLLGGLLGIVLGMGLVILREALARQVSDPEDVGRALALPVLGAIPQENSRQALPMRSAPHSARAEAYRAVLANLPYLRVSDGESQSVLITSAGSREGATTLAGNLAIALARSGRRVLLIDANLRSPGIHELFALAQGPGLSEVLAGEVPLTDAVHVLDAGELQVLTAGEMPEDPVERLTGAKSAAVLATLSSTADVVIFDSPPVVPVADALFLVRHVTSVVLTARVRTTRKDQLLRANDVLHQVAAPLAGVVVTGTAGGTERLRPRRRHGRRQAAVAASPRSAGAPPRGIHPGGAGVPEAG